MNYLAEIKLFYDWIETHHISTSAISLWHALMFTANRNGWNGEFTASISLLESRTRLSRAAIYKHRKELENAGIIRVISHGTKQSASYILHSFSASHWSIKKTDAESNQETDAAAMSMDKSTKKTHRETTLNKLNYTDTHEKKESQKRKKKNEGGFDIEGWAKALESPWRELMLVWLDYKRIRKESYRSEIGARKCLTMLKNLSNNDPNMAQMIIDQSMAKNWAGLFELKKSYSRPAAISQPQHGQRIGQIMQSEDESKRTRMLEKLRNAGNKKDDTNP